jgi:hypothetical protein
VEIRKIVVGAEETRRVLGKELGMPTVKAWAAAVVTNPYAGRYVDELPLLLDGGAEVGTVLGERALAALGGRPVTGYGKGAIVGLDGELEHAAAFIHPTFGGAIRAVIGGGPAIISSTKLVASAGAPLAIPITSREDVWSFDEMDTIVVSIPDAPRPDEIVAVIVLASGGRAGARTRKPGPR